MIWTGGKETERGSAVGNSGKGLATKANGMKGSVKGNLRNGELMHEPNAWARVEVEREVPEL